MVINGFPVSSFERDSLNGITVRSSRLRSSRRISSDCRRSTCPKTLREACEVGFEILCSTVLRRGISAPSQVLVLSFRY
jgi:hypothetical protein